MPNIFVNNNFFMQTAIASITDLTPPTFAGITHLTVESRGQIRAKWSAATDLTTPLRYEVYIKASTATGLFNTLNIVAITDKLQYDTFTMPDGSFLVNGTTYFVGVRALDAVSNRETNTVSMSVISTGVSVSAEIYATSGAFAINSLNKMQGTLWALKNSILATSSNSVLGTASYQVYDKAGVVVPGMGESGITVNGQGQFIITEVNSSLSLSLDHYMVKVTISVDGADRTDYVALIQEVPDYTILGAFTIDDLNKLVGSFWADSDGDRIDNLARLGSGSYTIRDVAGNLVSGLTQTGITSNAQGQFIITPITSTLDMTSSIYFVHLKIVIDGIEREQTVPLTFGIPEYEVKGQFSINASNQLLATFWATANGDVKTTSIGVANYTVYDASGNLVSGLTQSGITADVNGRFQITPVSAILLTDLTHYSVKIGIIVDGVERIAYKGFTLLGT